MEAMQQLGMEEHNCKGGSSDNVTLHVIGIAGEANQVAYQRSEMCSILVELIKLSGNCERPHRNVMIKSSCA